MRKITVKENSNYENLAPGLITIGIIPNEEFYRFNQYTLRLAGII